MSFSKEALSGYGSIAAAKVSLLLYPTMSFEYDHSVYMHVVKLLL